MFSKLHLVAMVSALSLLTACGEDDIILPGERFDIRPGTMTENVARPLALPATQANASWTHRNGGPAHVITHPALGPDLRPLFVTEIGAGDSGGARITAHPVVAGGVIYTLDARTRVSATATDGRLLWSRDLLPLSDRPGDASGGGISYDGGQLAVTTGFGELTLLDAATGATIWVQDLDAPAYAPPTFRDDVIYAVARDSTAWALERDNGRIRWQQAGAPSTANFSGGAAPAVFGEVVVLPFPSGEVLATYPDGGIPRWRSVVSGDRLGNVAGLINDISGDPVISDGSVYVGNFGGRTVSFDLASGERNWTAAEGAVSAVWPVADAIFLINDIGELVRLDRQSGDPVWRVALPTFAADRNTRRQRNVVAHYGPVLAGGRLIVTSSDGLIRQFDPVSGASLANVALPGGAASGPVVAGGTLYVVSKDGRLHAFR